MSDYIKREDAKDALREKVFSDYSNEFYGAMQVLDELLSADVVEAKHGKWEHNPNGIDRDFIWWKCSECGHVIYSETEQDRKEFHAYCGRCGARMDKVTDNE